jgi:hypothetical protein
MLRCLPKHQIKTTKQSASLSHVVSNIVYLSAKGKPDPIRVKFRKYLFLTGAIRIQLESRPAAGTGTEHALTAPERCDHADV